MTHSILVVDDTEANRYVLSRCLRQAGYDVTEAGDGRQALELVCTKPDLVVLDIRLPDIDGYEVCRRIKSDPVTRNTLVLNVSASFTNSEARITGLENGADGYLVQPMEPTEFLATVRSLLRLRDLERTAMRREARYKALVDASAQAVWALDATGAVTEEFGLCGLAGMPISRGGPDAWLDCLGGPDAETQRADWRRALAAGEGWSATVRIDTNAGPRHLALRLVPLRDQSTGPVLEWIGSANDITSKVIAERQLAEKVEELARSNQYLEHFAYVLSHDLQEPLRTITNYLDLIRHKAGAQLDERNERYFGYITDAAKRMRQLIHGVLDYSTVTRNGKPEPLPLDDALGEALANLGPLIERHRARISFDSLPTVHADRTQIVQLFQNLVGNAVKYTADRVPEVRITVRTEDGRHTIAIADNGIGMQREHLDQVFELFRRLHSHERYEGAGIGLALCRRIVEHNGGRIWAESTPGEGSVFTFTIPVG